MNSKGMVNLKGRKGIIYKAQNKITEKVYVGQTYRSLAFRVFEHLNYDRDTYFSRALKKHGTECFDISVIDLADTREELNEKEKSWISFYGCKYPNGYNLTDGGDGIVGLTEETKKKMSESGKKKIFTLEHRRNLSKASKGRPKSEEHKRKISKSETGKIVTQETREKLRKAIKGKTWEEIYGEEKAKKLKIKLSKRVKGKERKPFSEEHKRKISNTLKAKRII